MCQLRVLEGLIGFSSISFPCFSTKGLCLVGQHREHPGELHLSLT